MAKTPDDPFPEPGKGFGEARRFFTERHSSFEKRMTRHRAAFEARMAEERAAFEGRMAEARARMDQAGFVRRRTVAELAVTLTFRSGRQIPMPPRPKQPPKDKGGEPVPAVPRPRPKPLAGGAAAPLDSDRRHASGDSAPLEVRRVRSPTDADFRQGL